MCLAAVCSHCVYCVFCRWLWGGGAAVSARHGSTWAAVRRHLLTTHHTVLTLPCLFTDCVYSLQAVWMSCCFKLSLLLLPALPENAPVLSDGDSEPECNHFNEHYVYFSYWSSQTSSVFLGQCVCYDYSPHKLYFFSFTAEKTHSVVTFRAIKLTTIHSLHK